MDYDEAFKKSKEFCPEGYLLRGYLQDAQFCTYIFSTSKLSMEPDNYKVIVKIDGECAWRHELSMPIDEWLEGEYKLKELENWAICLNSPWSITDEEVVIGYNAWDSYSRDTPPGGKFRATYCVVGYEAITAVLYGYGDSFEFTLSECLAHKAAVQYKYNPEDDSF